MSASAEAEGDAYLLWSHKHGLWWRPGGEGYTRRVCEAGRFRLAEAVERAARAIPGTAQRMGALPVLPVPASVAVAMLVHYREGHPGVPAEEWE